VLYSWYKELLVIVDAFKEWCHLFEGAQHETIVYLNHKKLAIFHDNLCSELISSLMGIVIVLILISHHISHWSPTKEIKCIIPSLIPRASRKRCCLQTTMWGHFQAWTPSTSNIIDNSWWKNLFFIKFVKIWKKILLLLTSKAN
jgi:hypothetical protein